MNNTPNFDMQYMKKPIMIGLVSLTIIAVILLVAWYFSNSWLRVTTDAKDATIKISQNGKTIKEEKSNSLFTSVKPGRYTVEVKNSSSATAKFTDQKNGAFVSIDLDEVKVKDVGSIASRASFNLSISDTRLSYESDSSQGFYTVTDKDNLVAQPELRFEAIDWLNPDFGATIVTNILSEGMRQPELGIVSGGNFTKLSQPENASKIMSDVGVSDDKDILAVSNSVVYRKAASEDDFKQFYEGEGIIDILSARHNLVMFEQNSEEGEVLKGRLISVDRDGKEAGSIEAQFAIDPSNSPKASQSPDQQKIAVLMAGHITIYNQSLKKPVSLPQPDRVSSIAWKDDETLIFTSSNTIWSYSTKDSVARALAFDDQGRNIVSLAISENGKDIVFSSVGLTTSGTIKRVKLDGNHLGENSGEPSNQPIGNDSAPSASSTEKDQLSLVLPHYVTLAMCRADYMNFNKPTIVINKLNEKDQASMQANLDWCISEVKAYLDNQKVDYSGVEFKTVYTDSIK